MKFFKQDFFLPRFVKEITLNYCKVWTQKEAHEAFTCIDYLNKLKNDGKGFYLAWGKFHNRLLIPKTYESREKLSTCVFLLPSHIQVANVIYSTRTTSTSGEKFLKEMTLKFLWLCVTWKCLSLKAIKFESDGKNIKIDRVISF